MQIHELNNYDGEIGSDAYIAIDNGNDTGKVSAAHFLANTDAEISQLGEFLNARIDNIIAGGAAPSESEIVDARLGANGITYPSLGDAIRDQVLDITSALKVNTNDISLWVMGGISVTNGSNAGSSTRIRTNDFLPETITKVGVLAGYKYMIYAWNGDTYVGVWNGSSFNTFASWQTTDYAIDHSLGYKYKLVVGKSDDAVIDTSAYVNAYIYGVSDIALSHYGKAADAKTTGNFLRYLERDILENGNPLESDGFIHIVNDGAKIAGQNIVPFLKVFPSTYVDYTSGAVKKVDNIWSTEPIPLPERGEITITLSNGATWFCSQLNASKTWISGTAETGASKTITKQGNARFVVLSFYNNGTDGSIKVTDVDVKYSFDLFGFNYLKNLLTSGVNLAQIDVDEYAKRESGYYYDFQTGERKANAGWCNYIIPVKQGMQIIINCSTNLPFFAVQYKNNAYVSGAVVTPVNNTAIVTIGDADDLRIGIDLTSAIDDGIHYKQDADNVVYVGAGKDFETLISAIQYSKTVSNLKVIVTPQTYDLVEELGGTAYINANNMGTGIILDNGIHLLFETGAKVVLNYTGTNQTFMEKFSPFTARNESQTQANADYTIENLELECSNVRYGIHDDMGHSPTPYTHKYINCKITVNNTDNPAWEQNQCIGGGFGRYGYIEVDGGEFNSAPTESVVANQTYEITYHANDEQVDQNQYSKIVIKNAYCEHSVEALVHGNIAKKSTFIVTNCNLARLPHKTAGAVDNIEMIEWNNYIRS